LYKNSKQQCLDYLSTTEVVFQTQLQQALQRCNRQREETVRENMKLESARNETTSILEMIYVDTITSSDRKRFKKGIERLGSYLESMGVELHEPPGVELSATPSAQTTHAGNKN